MAISEWDKTKIQFKRRSPAFLLTVGFILFICTVIVFWNAIVEYQTQRETTNWIVTNATVSDIEIRVEGSRGSNYGAKSTYYEIYYEYTVDDQIYTGVMKNQNRSKDIGESLKIKYNPEAPDKSIHALEPSKEFLVTGPIFAVLFISSTALGIYWSKKYSSKKPEELGL